MQPLPNSRKWDSDEKTFFSDDLIFMHFNGKKIFIIKEVYYFFDTKENFKHLPPLYFQAKQK